MGWRGLPAMGRTPKRKLYLRRGNFFVIGRYIVDLRQDEKHVPDLLDSIIQPTDPVKEELRQKLSKIDQFGSKIKKMRVCTFQMSGKIPDSTNVVSEAIISTAFLQYLAALAAKYLDEILAQPPGNPNQGKQDPGECPVPSSEPIRRPAGPVAPPSPVARRSPGAPFP